MVSIGRDTDPLGAGLEVGLPERISVLLVEDNLPDARLVQELLSEFSAPDFDVSCVAQLSEACSELTESNPQCVLLDLLLPDARWLEAPARLRACAPCAPICR